MVILSSAAVATDYLRAWFRFGLVAVGSGVI
jgi:hypothetical protein